MRAVVVLLLLAGLALLAVRAEPLRPTVVLEPAVETIGHGTPIRVVASDRGTGLATVTLRLVPDGAAPVVLAEESFPRRSWWGSGVHEAILTPVVDAGAAHVPEGRATLEVWADDHSWLAGVFRR